MAGVSGLVCARNATTPIANTWRPNYQGNAFKSIEWNEAVLSVIAKCDIKHVFLICRWDVAVFGRPSGKLDTLIAPQKETIASLDSSRQTFSHELENTIVLLRDLGVTITLVAQPPTLSCHPNRTATFESRLLGLELNERCYTTTHSQERQHVISVLRSLSGPEVSVIEPAVAQVTGESHVRQDNFVDVKSSMVSFAGGASLYVDTNHLSPVGADLLYYEEIQREIASIVGDEND